MNTLLLAALFACSSTPTAEPTPPPEVAVAPTVIPSERPAPDSDVYKAVVTAVITKLQPDFPTQLGLNVNSLTTAGDFALLIADPADDKGLRISFEGTPYAAKGYGTCYALAKKSGVAWTVIELAINTDDPMLVPGWFDKHGAPQTLLGF